MVSQEFCAGVAMRRRAAGRWVWAGPVPLRWVAGLLTGRGWLRELRDGRFTVSLSEG
ncbi:hypothetical protein ACR820_03295 [Streptomyces netropsis]